MRDILNEGSLLLVGFLYQLCGFDKFFVALLGLFTAIACDSYVEVQ